MSDLLAIGASGVRAYQTALTTTSENIANAGTAGYVRRTTTMREVASAGSYSSGSLNGSGVIVEGVGRSSNPYTEAAVRNAGADLARTQASSVWLQRIETALGGGALPTQMTAFFGAATALQGEPTSTALRAGMLSAASSVADSFGVTARSLDESMTELDSRAVQNVDELNRLNQAVLKVNQGLMTVVSGTSAAAALQDQRDQLLEKMSDLTDIDAQFDAFGRATVRAGGNSGPVLVDVREATNVRYGRTAGNVALQVVRGDGTSQLMTPEGGALAGVMEGAQRIFSTRQELGAIADKFTSTVNTLQRSGQDLNGATGTDLFTVAAGDPTKITVALTDGAKIAAAKTGGQRDASNLATLAGLRVSDDYEGRIQKLVTQNAATLKQRNLVSDAQTAIHDGALTARSELSGVNFDAEAIDLVRFQQAYQASSRVVQVARETFQSILEIR
ncbi:flagellar hook-associated protein FlgK [uncultured Sphingomonas sp.]|uniref:flagellar hook-associated protein FlgK n=1 Tax=uncultured Sphingomonas sp. TaxID=158754 RepID=UPI002584D487|nr:flagellar hook-associated protein FlgK [uncultured Sphingomonas sp.]